MSQHVAGRTGGVQMTMLDTAGMSKCEKKLREYQAWFDKLEATLRRVDDVLAQHGVSWSEECTRRKPIEWRVHSEGYRCKNCDCLPKPGAPGADEAKRSQL